MNALLKDVLAKLDKLSPERQNELAALLLAEMEADERWDARFAKSQDELETMADEALDEHARGETRPPDSSVLCHAQCSPSPAPGSGGSIMLFPKPFAARRIRLIACGSPTLPMAGCSSSECIPRVEFILSASRAIGARWVS